MYIYIYIHSEWIYVYIYVYISLCRYIYTHTLINYDYLEKYFKNITKKKHIYKYKYIYVYVYLSIEIDIDIDIYRYRYRYVHTHWLVKDKSKIINYIAYLSLQTIIVCQFPMIKMPGSDSSEIRTGIFYLNDFNSAQR